MADADTIFAGYRKQKGWHLTAGPKTDFLEQRLKAAFAWGRIKALLGTVGEANVVGTVDDEVSQVNAFLNGQLGDNRKTGPLLMPRPPGETDPLSHLDLRDLAKQTTDPGKPKDIASRAKAFVNARRDAVMTIVWRAAVLEGETLWTPNTTTPTPPRNVLATARLKELLDRRLRVVERMRCQVGNYATMLRENELFVLSFSGPKINWRDGLRVRLFEYPTLPWAEISRIPNISDDDWEFTAHSASYTVFQSVDRRSTDNTQVGGTTLVAWRFPTNVADNWQVSAGMNAYYRIDFLTGPQDPVAVIDELFDYRGTVGAQPKKADLWNRAWLLCDQVISTLQIEALLFGLRRNTTAGQPAAENLFRGLVAKRPIVTVNVPDGVGLKQVETAFVSLDGHVRTVAGGNSAEPKILMRSNATTGDFVDPYFNNTVTSLDRVQVGDWVKLLNSPVYDAIGDADSVWGLENALVMGFAPTADFQPNRLAVDLSTLRVQGHGTDVVSYDGMRRTLAKELQDQLENVYKKIRELPNSQFGFVHGPHHVPVFRWSPYSDVTTVKIKVSQQVNGRIQQVFQSFLGPWWIALTIDDYGGSIVKALASIPHSIGEPEIRLVPTPPPRLNIFRLGADERPVDKFVFFPLMEPVISAADIRDARLPPWTNYIATRVAGPIVREFRSLAVEGDLSFIPGLFAFDRLQVRTVEFGVVRPKPGAV